MHLCGKAGAESMRFTVILESLLVSDDTGGERGFVGGRSIRFRRVAVGAGGVVSIGVAGDMVSMGGWTQNGALVLSTTLEEDTSVEDLGLIDGRSGIGLGKHLEVSKSAHFDGRDDSVTGASKGAIVFIVLDAASIVDWAGSFFLVSDLWAKPSRGDLG